jgi:hypothetical protein
MDRPRRDSRQHNGITVRGLPQPTFATKSANNGSGHLVATVDDTLRAEPLAREYQVVDSVHGWFSVGGQSPKIRAGRRAPARSPITVSRQISSVSPQARPTQAPKASSMMYMSWSASCGTIDGEPGIATNTPMCAQRQLLEPSASAEPFA